MQIQLTEWSGDSVFTSQQMTLQLWPPPFTTSTAVNNATSDGSSAPSKTPVNNTSTALQSDLDRTSEVENAEPAQPENNEATSSEATLEDTTLETPKPRSSADINNIDTIS